MISVKEAQSRILRNLQSFGSEQLRLSAALRRVLAADIKSPVSHPLFTQSAVDGYAIRYDDALAHEMKRKTFKIVGESKTGEFKNFKVKADETVKIFTGALVPNGCDTVIMKEDVAVKGGYIIVKAFPALGSSVRTKGGQIKKGMTALKKGTLLNHASLGFLSSLGIDAVRVSKLPRVSVIVTGNEFAGSKAGFRKGSVYESNGIMLTSLLGELRLKARVSVCKDDPDKLTLTVKSETEKSEIVIITGGVSVGDYDFTKTALNNCGYKTIFHKVFQKPGKPLLFAKKKNKTAFGLPGNPRSVLVCYFEYVYPFIQASMGNRDPFLQKLVLPLSGSYIKREEKSLYLTSKLTENGVQILERQDSHMLKSFSDAQGLVCLPEGKKKFSTGESVSVRLLP